MQSTTSAAPITTGFSDFDTLLQANGVPAGNICTVRSDPNASAYEFLLSVLQANHKKAHFITTTHRKSSIVDACRRVGSNTVDSSRVIDLSDDATGADLLDAIAERSFDHRDVLFIDSLNAITDGNKQVYSELYRELKRIATDYEAVVFCHYLTGSDEHQSLPPTVDYLTDLLLSLSVTKSEEGVKQKLWIERLPVGEGLKESQQDTRLISVNSSSGQLSLNTGGRI